MMPDNNISIKIDDKDLGSMLSFDNDKLPDGFKYQNEKYIANIKSNMKDIVVKKPYLTIRCVDANYFPYMGKTLCDSFGTYDKALNLVLGGNLKKNNKQFNRALYCLEKQKRNGNGQ